MTQIEKDIKEIYKGKEVTISMDEYMSLYEIMVQATSLSEYADEGDTYNFMVKSCKKTLDNTLNNYKSKYDKK